MIFGHKIIFQILKSESLLDNEEIGSEDRLGKSDYVKTGL